MSTSPFEREVLTHHFTSDADFPRPSELYYLTVARFAQLGLLETAVNGDIHSTEACKVYMGALAAVPFPVQRWVMPDSSPNGS